MWCSLGSIQALGISDQAPKGAGAAVKGDANAHSRVVPGSANTSKRDHCLCGATLFCDTASSANKRMPIVHRCIRIPNIVLSVRQVVEQHSVYKNSLVIPDLVVLALFRSRRFRHARFRFELADWDMHLQVAGWHELRGVVILQTCSLKPHSLYREASSKHLVV